MVLPYRWHEEYWRKSNVRILERQQGSILVERKARYIAYVDYKYIYVDVSQHSYYFFPMFVCVHRPNVHVVEYIIF